MSSPGLLPSHDSTLPIDLQPSHASTLPIQLDSSTSPQEQLMQGIKQGGFPVVAPDGKSGFVHNEMLQDFLKSNPGYKRATIITAPDGTPGMVPLDSAASFLKANPDYISGQPKTQVETNLLAHNRFTRDFQGDQNVPPQNVTQTAYGPIHDTIVDATKLIGANLKAEGEAPNAPDLVKNVTSPVGQASAEFAGNMYAPSTIGLMGASSAVPATTPILRLLHRGASALLAGQMGVSAAGKGKASLDAASRGDIPEAVHQGAGALYDAGFAAGSAGDVVKSAPGTIADTKAVARSVQESKPAQFVGDKLQTARAALNPAKASPEQAATMAFRPRNSKYQWKEQVASALPDMRRAADSMGVDPENMTLRDAADAVRHAKRDVWSEYETNFSGPNSGATVDTSPVAQTIRSTISQRTAEQNPQLAEKIDNVAKTYEGRNLSLGNIEDRISELNRETRAIEARYPADKQAAQEDPSNAYTFAERNALRNLMTSKMSELSGPGADALRQRYGALKSVEDVIQRRIPVAERQAPEPLPKMLAKMYAAGKIAKGVATLNPLDVVEGAATIAAGNRAAKLRNPDYLTQQAFKQTKPTLPWLKRYQAEYQNSTDLPPSSEPPQNALPAGQYDMPASPLSVLYGGNKRLQPQPTVSSSRQLPESTAGASFELPEKTPPTPGETYVAGRPESALPPFLKRGTPETAVKSPSVAPEKGAGEIQGTQPKQETPASAPYETGKPATIAYLHNTEKAPNMGARFGQDVEPVGKYIQERDGNYYPKDDPRLETGTVQFNNPLVMDFGGGYQEPTNWKNVLSQRFGGKTGKSLSAAIKKAGYDGIITIGRYGKSVYTSEIVDLSGSSPAPAKGAEVQSQVSKPASSLPPFLKLGKRATSPVEQSPVNSEAVQPPVEAQPQAAAPLPQASSPEEAPIYDQQYRGPVDINAIDAIRKDPKQPKTLRDDAQFVHEAVVDSGMPIADAMRLNGTDALAKALGGKLDKTINAQRQQEFVSPKAEEKKPKLEVPRGTAEPAQPATQASSGVSQEPNPEAEKVQKKTEIKPQNAPPARTISQQLERGVARQGDVSVKIVANGDHYGVETTVAGDRRYPTEPPMAYEDAKKLAIEQLKNPRPTQMPQFEAKSDTSEPAKTQSSRPDPYDFADEMARQGVGRSESYSRWIQRTGLNPGMDARDWNKIYDSAKRLPPAPEVQAKKEVEYPEPTPPPKAEKTLQESVAHLESKRSTDPVADFLIKKLDKAFEDKRGGLSDAQYAVQRYANSGWVSPATRAEATKPVTVPAEPPAAPKVSKSKIPTKQQVTDLERDYGMTASHSSNPTVDLAVGRAYQRWQEAKAAYLEDYEAKRVAKGGKVATPRAPKEKPPIPGEQTLEQKAAAAKAEPLTPSADVPQQGRNFEGRYVQAALEPVKAAWLDNYQRNGGADSDREDNWKFMVKHLGQSTNPPPAHSKSTLFIKVPDDGSFMIPNNPRAIDHALNAAQKFVPLKGDTGKRNVRPYKLPEPTEADAKRYVKGLQDDINETEHAIDLREHAEQRVAELEKDLKQLKDRPSHLGRTAWQLEATEKELENYRNVLQQSPEELQDRLRSAREAMAEANNPESHGLPAFLKFATKRK